MTKFSFDELKELLDKEIRHQKAEQNELPHATRTFKDKDFSEAVIKTCERFTMILKNKTEGKTTEKVKNGEQLYSRDFVDRGSKSGQFDYLLFNDAEFMRTEKRDEQRFEDDGTLFFKKDNICIYEYFGQDKKITKAQENMFYTSAIATSKKLCERFDEILSLAKDNETD